MDRLFTAFLMASFAMSAAIVMLLVLNKWSAQKVPASFRYYMWSIVLAGLLIPFRPSIPMPFKPPFEPLSISAKLENLVNVENLADGSTQYEPYGTPQPGLSDPVGGVRTGGGQISGAQADGDQISGPQARTAIAAPPLFAALSRLPVSCTFICFSIWLAGAFTVLAIHLRAYCKFISSVRRWGAEPEDGQIDPIMQTIKANMGLSDKEIRIKACAFISSPMLVGLFNPTILLPEKPIPTDELECIFKHELTHYKRKDLYMNLLVLLVSALHWFNPLVYIMAKAIRADCEAACDETVVAGDCVDTRRRYGETIIGFISPTNAKGPILSTYFYGGSNSMKKRLSSIMDTRKKSKWIPVFTVLAVLLVTVLSGAAFASSNNNSQYIGEAKAKSIALAHAGISEQQATFIRSYLDYDDHGVVYDIEFYNGNTEYDYEIDAVNGNIRDFSQDIEYYSIPANASASSNTAASGGTDSYVGEAKAKAVALSHAGLSESQANFIKANLDYDGGRVVYDVEFYSGSAEYDYKIDAVSGTVFAYDQDIEHYWNPNASQTPGAGNYIGEAKAKSIALANAGLTEAQVTFMKAHLDSDDGVVIYDVEFYTENTEYDYEIDASSGAVREFDQDIEYRRVPSGATGNNGGSGQPAQSAQPTGQPSQPSASGNTGTGQYIGEVKAKSIALAAAGLSESQISQLELELDYENGRATYEVGFNNGRMEYDYEIDATSGAILQSDVEYDD